MGRLDGDLNVLRIMIASMNNDQVFQTTCDKKFALMQKAKIARPQEGTFASVRDTCAKCRAGFIFQAPISLCHAGSRNPNFADLIWLTWLQRGRVNNDDLLVNDGFSATDHGQ